MAGFRHPRTTVFLTPLSTTTELRISLQSQTEELARSTKKSF